MSTNLYWEPCVPPDGKPIGSTQLKFILRDRFGCPDVDTTLDSSDLPYLEGLRDASVEGAAGLIEAITKHDTIRVCER